MWTKSVLCAAVAAVIGSLWSADIPAYDATYTKEGVTYAQRGGLGVKDFVVTNILVNGQPKPLPPYLYQLDLDDTYPEDAEWYYQHADYSGGRCSARRDGNLVERNYDWHFDDAATFVLKVSGNEGRFASVGVANVGTNLTDSLVRSGAHSRYYKCLAGHTVDGINENGVCAEVNVTDGRWPRTSGTVHGLGAVRWVLDHGTNAQQAAEYLADNVYLPDTYGRNLHWLVADRTSTYLVENCRAIPISGRAVLTNFSRDEDGGGGGEGYERYERLFNGASIVSQWWTLAYLPETRPIRFTDLGTNYESIWERWASKPREAHRGESFGGRFWWQTVHCSIYDLQNLTLRIAVQEVEDWYIFAVPTTGKVKSVNGRTGEVVLDAAAVNALPDDKDKLVENDNFKEAVATVSPPVELPPKWALANVTNANGQAVGANDVGAAPIDEGGLVDASAFRGNVALVNGIYNQNAGAPWIDVANGVLNPDVPDSKWYYHGSDGEHEIAVKGDIPKLPTKWALANITNANGRAVGAADVGAVASNSLVDWKKVRKEYYGGDYINSYRLRIYSDDAGIDDSEYAVEIDPINFYYVNSYDGHDYQFDNGFRVQNGSLCSNFGSDRIDWASYGDMYELYFPQETGTLALEGYRSLSRSFMDASTNSTAECESIATNICKLIAPHIEPVNVVAEYWDDTLKADWVLYIDNEDMKFSVKTNTDQTAFIRANPVLDDRTSKLPYRVVIEDAEMKFFTK